MSDNQDQTPPPKQNLLYKFDGFVKRIIPNFNARAILYFSLIFAIAMYLQIWRINSHTPVPEPQTQETVIADDTYWESNEYQAKIHNQTVTSFTTELEEWLNEQNQEFSRRKFEDILLINGAQTIDTGGDLVSVVPESFNYLENHARERFKYAKSNKFLSDTPTLISHGNVVCDLDEKTEKASGIELFEWRYASMPKLASFMNTKPDWKIQVGDRILDVSDPRIEDKDILALKNAQTQPAGLFSFLVFRDSQNNRIYLADSTILEKNGVDSRLTMSSLSNKSPKLHFRYGFEGCKQINTTPEVNYDQFD